MLRTPVMPLAMSRWVSLSAPSSRWRFSPRIASSAGRSGTKTYEGDLSAERSARGTNSSRVEARVRGEPGSAHVADRVRVLDAVARPDAAAGTAGLCRRHSCSAFHPGRSSRRTPGSSTADRPAPDLRHRLHAARRALSSQERLEGRVHPCMGRWSILPSGSGSSPTFLSGRRATLPPSGGRGVAIDPRRARCGGRVVHWRIPVPVWGTVIDGCPTRCVAASAGDHRFVWGDRAVFHLNADLSSAHLRLLRREMRGEASAVRHGPLVDQPPARLRASACGSRLPRRGDGGDRRRVRRR